MSAKFTFFSLKKKKEILVFMGRLLIMICKLICNRKLYILLHMYIIIDKLLISGIWQRVAP